MVSDDSKHSGVNHSKSIRKWKWTFVFSLVFAIPTIIIAFIPVEWATIVPGLTAKEPVLFLLSTIVQVSGTPMQIFQQWLGLIIACFLCNHADSHDLANPT